MPGPSPVKPEENNSDFSEIKACRFLKLVSETGLISMLSPIEYKVMTAYLMAQVSQKSYTLGVSTTGFSALLNVSFKALRSALNSLYDLKIVEKLDAENHSLMNNIRFSFDVFEDYYIGIEPPEGENGPFKFPDVEQ